MRQTIVHTAATANASPTTRMPTSSVDSLRAELVSQFNESSNSACSVYLPTNPYLSYLPSRIGKSTALDDAIKCVCVARLPGASDTGFTDYHPAQPEYTKALRSLAGALGEVSSFFATETLAAVVLLQMFEQFVNKNSSIWIQHAGGALRLIEARGPHLFKGDLERAILDSQMGRIMFECVRGGRDSFLADAGWQAVFQKSKVSDTAPGSQMSAAELGYHQVLSLLPGILKQYLHWQQAALVNPQTVQVPQCCKYPCAVLEARSDEITLYQLVNRFGRELRRWRLEHAAQLFCAATAGCSEMTNPSGTKVRTAKLSMRTAMALDCVSATLLVIANHMLLQIRQGRILCFESSLEVVEALDVEHPPCTCEEDRLDVLMAESVEYANIASNACSLLRQRHPTPARLLENGLATIWRKATELHFRGTHSCRDPILRVVGCLW